MLLLFNLQDFGGNKMVLLQLELVGALFSGIGLLAIIGGAIVWLSIKIIDPTERGLVERFGAYHRYAEPGIHFLFPFAESLRRVNVTEQMVDAERQEVITDDNLNATVDAQVYFQILPKEENVKNSQYNVNDVETQIVALARTTLRNIIGNQKFKDVNSKRNQLNASLEKDLTVQTKGWGIRIVRTEIKEIEPPKDVQDTMNRIMKAENEKVAASDFAQAAKIEAEGKKLAAIEKAVGSKKAAILEAEGQKEAQVLVAQGKAQAIKDVSVSAQTYFKDNAVQYEMIRALPRMFRKNTKYVVESNSSIGELLKNFLPIVDSVNEKQKKQRGG